MASRETGWREVNERRVSAGHGQDEEKQQQQAIIMSMFIMYDIIVGRGRVVQGKIEKISSRGLIPRGDVPPGSRYSPERRPILTMPFVRVGLRHLAGGAMRFLGRTRFWRRWARRVGVVVVLVAYLVAAVGFPVPASAARGDGVPFPCMDHPCGCQSAEQCWRGCCCLTVEERWAWAREHNVEPPPYARAPPGPEEVRRPRRAGTPCVCATRPKGKGRPPITVPTVTERPPRTPPLLREGAGSCVSPCERNDLVGWAAAPSAAAGTPPSGSPPGP